MFQQSLREVRHDGQTVGTNWLIQNGFCAVLLFVWVGRKLESSFTYNQMSYHLQDDYGIKDEGKDPPSEGVWR